MQESFWWWQCSDRYIVSLSPHLHAPFPPFSPSLISLMVSVDVKHHVYLLTYLQEEEEEKEKEWSQPSATHLFSCEGRHTPPRQGAGSLPQHWWHGYGRCTRSWSPDSWPGTWSSWHPPHLHGPTWSCVTRESRWSTAGWAFRRHARRVPIPVLLNPPSLSGSWEVLSGVRARLLAQWKW